MTNNRDDWDPKEAIAELSANLQQPHKFAQIFCEAAKNQKMIDEVLKDIVKDLIKNDSELQQKLKEYIREVDKEDWRNLLKKVGFSAWSAIVFVAGILVTGLIQRVLLP